jgi:TRAP-type C4-dicarboxylate transport system substrate-binding protein
MRTHFKGQRVIYALLGVILVFVLAFSITACSKTTTTTATTTATSTSTATTTVTPITLVFSSNEAANGFLADSIYKPWFAKVEQATNGRVKIEAHWNSELYSIFDVYDALVKGRIDLAEVITSAVPNVFSLDDITTFSLYDKLDIQPTAAYMELYNKYPEIRDQYKDVKFLWVMTTATNYLACTKPVQTLADFKGLKFLAPGQWGGERISALGAVPVTMAPPDAYPSLQKGTLDAIAAPASGLRDFGWAEVANQITIVPISAANFATLMSPQAWAKLPADVQQEIMDAGAGMPSFVDQAQVQDNQQEEKAFVTDFKATFYHLSAADTAQMNTLDEAVKNKWADSIDAKGLPGRAIMDDWLALLNKYAQ